MSLPRSSLWSPKKGLSAFVKDGVSVVEFFTGTKWDLANTAENGLPYTGALPLIVTSFAVMVLSTLIALPIAIGSAIFAVEISPKFGSKIFQPLIELLTGIPSVVFGLIGFHVVVGLMKSVFHVSTGLGILPGAIVLAVMILPTMTTLSVDGLRAVPDGYRQGSLALGYTRWQTIWHVVLKSAMPSLMTAVILGMTRAFGETLAVRMVIGGIEAMPTSLLSPASTITTTLTTSMAVYAEGSAQDDVLWALGLLLMGMSLIFILIIHLIGRKGRRLVASTRIHIDEARLGRVQKQDRIATGVLTAIVAIVMLIVISMVAYILFEGISTLFQPGFLTEPSRANGTQGGVLYQLFDSFYLLLITLIISVPISLGGAVFLVEYAPDGPIRDIASYRHRDAVLAAFHRRRHVWLSGVLGAAGLEVLHHLRRRRAHHVQHPHSGARDSAGARGRATGPARCMPGHGPHPLGGHAAHPDSRGHARHRDRHRAFGRPRLWRGRGAALYLGHELAGASELLEL